MSTAILAVSARRWKEKELKHLREMVPANRVAIDIGAAHGTYAWHLARIARECIAFEPQRDLADRLRISIPRATVHNCALSDKTGTTTMRIPRQGRTVHTGHATIDPANRLSEAAEIDSVEVEVRTLNSFDIRDVGFIKIDVEGHELAVLRGARQTLERDKPILLIEIEDKHQPQGYENTVRWLGQIGYRRSDGPCSPQNYLFMNGIAAAPNGRTDAGER